jgi:hypothetical protein
MAGRVKGPPSAAPAVATMAASSSPAAPPTHLALAGRSALLARAPASSPAALSSSILRLHPAPIVDSSAAGASSRASSSSMICCSSRALWPAGHARCNRDYSRADRPAAAAAPISAAHICASASLASPSSPLAASGRADAQSCAGTNRDYDRAAEWRA